jgi:pyridine nucleotide-disulfide oxidoreductase family protein
MRRLILAGGGHAHLAVLHALAARRVPDLEVILVTPAAQSIYSGMVPGWMAGHYPLSACSINLRAIADAARVRLLELGIAGIDARQQLLLLADGSRCAYDLLSMDVGSETEVSGLEALGERLLPVRPISRFVDRWVHINADAGATAGYRLVVVGGGAAGIELAFAARQAFVAQHLDASVALVTSERGLLPEQSVRAATIVRYWLMRRGIAVLAGRAAGVESGVLLSSDQLVAADCVIAASGARAPGWLQSSGLALDEAGYVLVDASHRSVSHASVFAAGDVCARPDSPLARSGVYAVRAGPVLANNLLATLAGEPLRLYHPRRRSLYLLATGPRHAVASWGAVGFSGRWVWRLKDSIDRRFISMNSVTSAARSLGRHFLRRFAP